jgi:hypothetical protein
MIFPENRYPLFRSCSGNSSLSFFALVIASPYSHGRGAVSANLRISNK